MKNVKKYMLSLLTVTMLGLATDSFALLGFGNKSAATSAALLREFQEMESGHKADWISHMKNEKASFFNLMAKEQKGCSKLQAEALRKFELLSGSNNEATFNSVLNDAVALHAREKADWKAERMAIEKQCHDLAAKHDKEFNAFIKKLNAQKKLHIIEPAAVLSGKEVVDIAPDFPAE
ncbi:MAG: hypothetical protein P4L31_03150 [Candidatus Babeliales bacterium]|nr:hypothetical protein [Candidatus Babeliales bacterium]